MWQPPKLNRQESAMRQLGLQIPVSKIYNDEGTGLNNAVVLFGGGCTAEFVSSKGLLFTNHHCGYKYAQALSTPDNNFLLNGFWAMSPGQELPCPGLTVTVTRKMKNVTDYILSNISDTLIGEPRKKLIEDRIANLEKAYQKAEGYEAEIKPFYNGNQYWVILQQTFEDVRLAAFPPNGIGKFGADTDNWMWPRMTGDFSVFRVYASPDNQPAPYSTANVPYRPDKHFSINISGYDKGDFTMVYGYPYRTQEYLSSYELGRIQHIMDPLRIEIRRKKLAIWDQAMRADPSVFLKYAAKQSSVSNGFKKWQGEIQGLELNHVMDKKKAYERQFEYAAAANTDFPGDKLILTRMSAAVKGNKNALYATEFIREAVYGIEIVREAALLHKILQAYREGADPGRLHALYHHTRQQFDQFFKNYVPSVDQKVFEALLPYYLQQNPQIIAPGLNTLWKQSGEDISRWAGVVFGTSVMTADNRIDELLTTAEPADTTAIKSDPAFQIFAAVHQFLKQEIQPDMASYEATMAPLKRIYMKRQMEYLNSGRDFYPDANQTLRLSYGKVEPLYLSGDSKPARYQTTLHDLIPRHNDSIQEFDIPDKLRMLYRNKDFGRWVVNGSVPVNFIASNHTSGGNSGSPVLNGKGELIGINFDRAWQGTMSDLYFDPNLCRNISVDIRYVLFIIEKFGNAGWMLDEMTLVK